MTKQKHPADDDFFKLWETEIQNVEEEVFNTAEMTFDRMRAIHALVKNSNLPIDDPAVARHVYELKSLEKIAKGFTSCFMKAQQIFEVS
tara:strand:- start:1097 stop:1363 length:267 start_codon:yes stop_codon:yes gene_type:complete